MKRLNARATQIALRLLVLALSACTTTGGGSEDLLQIISSPPIEEGDVDSSRPISATISDLETIYFDYDKSSVRADSVTVLRGNAALIRENESWGEIVIEGNTDERGSEEYNLALGERRAMTVKRFLVDYGVSPDRLQITSFGEANPAIAGHDESSYRYSRRATFAANTRTGMGGKPPVRSKCLQHCVDPSAGSKTCYAFDDSLGGLCDRYLSKRPEIAR